MKETPGLKQKYLYSKISFRLPIIIFNANQIPNELIKIIFYRFTMEVETKQLYFFIIISALSLKTNARQLVGLHRNESFPTYNTSLGPDDRCETSLNEIPNIEYALYGRFILLVC